jgi:hypothetical protein
MRDEKSLIGFLANKGSVLKSTSSDAFLKLKTNTEPLLAK